VSTKGDLGGVKGPADVAISARTGEGMADLLARISEVAETALGHGDAILTRERHREALARTASALVRAEAVDGETELAAEDVRLALRALGQITGRVDVEDVLDRLFATFCIGK
jgi:tRNA modification GTPase